MSSDETGVEGPECRVGSELTKEDVDEKGRSKGALGDAKIGDPFRVRLVICVSAFDRTARGAAIQSIDSPFDRRHVPWLKFRVGVSKGIHIARGGRGPELTARSFMKRFQGSVCIQRISLFDGCRFRRRLSGCDPGVGVDRLPDGKKPVNVRMVQPEYRIKCRVLQLSVD